jgi:hypothetical protein
MTPTDWDGWIIVLTIANAVGVLVMVGLIIVVNLIERIEKRRNGK